MPLHKIASLLVCVIFLAGCSSVPLLDEKGSAFDKLYRRVPYKVEGRYRVLNIFYATSRKVEKKDSISESFRAELGKENSYGIVEVRLDPALKIGKMLPAWYKKRDIMGMQGVEPLEKDIFMQQLSDTVKESPHKSLFVVVFGYKDNFEYTAIKTAYFSYLLDVDTPVLLFDWPGDQAVTPWGYMKARELAKSSGEYLGRLLADIIRDIKPENLWIEASSLGSQVVCDAFEEMYKHEDLADTETEIDHVILAAPDVTDKEFDKEFKKEIIALSDRLTTYVSSNDDALLMSEFIQWESKLGRQKSKGKKHDQFDEAKDMLYLKSLMPGKVSVVDVTPINKASYNHGYYLEAPQFFDDLYLRIFEKPPHVNRRLYLLKTDDDTDYWVLKSGN